MFCEAEISSTFEFFRENLSWIFKKFYCLSLNDICDKDSVSSVHTF